MSIRAGKSYQLSRLTGQRGIFRWGETDFGDESGTKYKEETHRVPSIKIIEIRLYCEYAYMLGTPSKGTLTWMFDLCTFHCREWEALSMHFRLVGERGFHVEFPD